MLLDMLQKIMSSLVTQRLQDLLKIVGIEEQYGFLVGRGTTDGVFVVKDATNKRRNAGEDSWVLFVDLVKALDSVPRVGMLAILKKFGIKGGSPLQGALRVSGPEGRGEEGEEKWGSLLEIKVKARWE